MFKYDWSRFDASLGIVGGFYCGWFFPDPWVGNLVTAIAAFMGLERRD